MERCPSKCFCMPRRKTSVHTALALLQALQLLQASKGKTSPLQYIFAQTYTLYIAPGRVAIVTMVPELSLSSRVDTKVRNKALFVAFGCQACEQVCSAPSWLPQEKKAMWRRCRRRTSEVRHDSNRTHLVFQLAVCFWVLELPLFFWVYAVF